MFYEPTRAQQSLLLAGERYEQDAAFRCAYPARLVIVRHLDQEGNICGVVERSVVKVVAIERRAESIAIQVRADHDVFGFECRCHARKYRDDVRRADVALRDLQLNAQLARNLETWQRLLRAARFEQC